MIDVHFMVPPEVIDGLLSRFHIYHQDGHQGYFGALIHSEILSIISLLIDADYRVDITPGNVYKLMARKV